MNTTRQSLDFSSVPIAFAQLVGAPTRVVAFEIVLDLRMAHGIAALIIEQILLRYIGDIFGVVVLREEVIEGLVLARADVFRDRAPPFFSIREYRIDIEYDTSEREQAVSHDLTYTEFRQRQFALHC